MFVATLFIFLTCTYTIVNVVLVLFRNYRAHQFFATKTPKLPVVPNPGLFDGHMHRITLRKKNWLIIEQYHQQLGPTYGFYMAEQPWVSTTDLDLLKLIEIDQPHKHINRAKFGLPFREFNHSIFQVDDDQWRRVRRAIAPALTNHKVRSDEVSSDIAKILEQLQDGIEYRMQKENSKSASKSHDEVNNNIDDLNQEDADKDRSIILHVDDMFQRYTLAVIFLITYRQDNKIDFRAERDEWVDKMEEAARQIVNPFVALSIMFPFLRPFIEFLVQLHPVGKMNAQIVDYIVEATDINRVAREQHSRIQRKLSIETGCKERPFSDLKKTNLFKRRLVDTIIDALIDKKIQYDQFIGSTLFLLLAGFETTADTITCLIWQLARNPDIQEKLRASIDRHGIESEYLGWCVQETVRYHPAVMLGVGRILGEDVQVNGLMLPKGCFVMPATHTIHHDPSIWPEPERFNPERWRNANEFHPAAFMGFGLGPRNCVGGKLAVHEIKMVTRLLLSNYRIEKCAETPEVYQFSTPGLLYANVDVPIKVRLVSLMKSNRALSK